jgi:hypothetical protein
VSSTSSSTKAGETANSKNYNIFKSALNRSITFFSKIATNSGSITPTTSTSTSVSKPTGSESVHEISSSSETPSDSSSPDSLQTELIFFKPIIREPKTPSSSKSVLLRVPSIRSTASSTDRHFSPCPSPFFIPIAKRQSAFTFVGDSKDDEKRKIIKPKATKRKDVKPPQIVPQKRMKQEAPPRARISRQASSDSGKPKDNGTRNARSLRQTRSSEKKESSSTAPTASQSFPKPRAPATKTAKKPSPRKNPPAPVKEAEVIKRVTRSQSLKH